MRIQEFIEGVRENGFLQILQKGGRAENFVLEIDIVSSKLGDVRVTVTKIMAKIHVKNFLDVGRD